MLLAARIAGLGGGDEVGPGAPVEDVVIDEAVKARVSAGERAHVGEAQACVGRLAVVEFRPERIAGHGEAAVPVAEHRKSYRAAGCRIDPGLDRGQLLEKGRAGPVLGALEATRFQVDAAQPDRPVPCGPQGDINPRAQLRVSYLQRGHIGMPLESEPLADGEADRLPDEELVGMATAAGPTHGAGPVLHDDAVARRIDDASRRRRILGFLEGDDISVEAVRDPPHRLIILGPARLAAGTILFGEEFEVPAGQPERPGGSGVPGRGGAVGARAWTRGAGGEGGKEKGKGEMRDWAEGHLPCGAGRVGDQSRALSIGREAGVMPGRRATADVRPIVIMKQVWHRASADPPTQPAFETARATVHDWVVPSGRRGFAAYRRTVRS
ncbi:hypothetical protein NOVOSPHI9U_620013 [Novosphingobium sp. 9U]|nr:hypothetical protein NOVOSPHI9U_620013 [Novosphingobium sp. 9U]